MTYKEIVMWAIEKSIEFEFVGNISVPRPEEFWEECTEKDWWMQMFCGLPTKMNVRPGEYIYMYDELFIEFNNKKVRPDVVVMLEGGGHINLYRLEW